MRGAFDTRGLLVRDLNRIAELERLCNPIPWTLPDLQTFAAAADTPGSLSGATSKTLSGRLSTRVGRLAVLLGTGEVVGYVCAQVTDGEAEILLFGVAPEHRRQGIGRALLLDLRTLLKSLDCQNAFLEVRAGNEGALFLYRSAGFVESGIRKHYYADTGEDARLMRWDLSG